VLTQGALRTTRMPSTQSLLWSLPVRARVGSGCTVWPAEAWTARHAVTSRSKHAAVAGLDTILPRSASSTLECQAMELDSNVSKRSTATACFKLFDLKFSCLATNECICID